MNLGKIVTIYFVVGLLVWAGGGIAWENVGMANQLFTLSDGDQVSTNSSMQQKIEKINPQKTSSVITTLKNTVTVGLSIVWPVLTQFVGYMFWPYYMLESQGAPPKITLLVGGPLVMMFLISLVQMIARRI